MRKYSAILILTVLALVGVGLHLHAQAVTPLTPISTPEGLAKWFAEFNIEWPAAQATIKTQAATIASQLTTINNANGAYSGVYAAANAGNITFANPVQGP